MLKGTQLAFPKENVDQILLLVHRGDGLGRAKCGTERDFEQATVIMTLWTRSGIVGLGLNNGLGSHS